MYLGKQQGCSFNDRIDLSLSPSDVESLIEILKDKALNAQDYSEQGIWRELKDHLQDEFDNWRKLRDEKDREAA